MLVPLLRAVMEATCCKVSRLRASQLPPRAREGKGSWPVFPTASLDVVLLLASWPVAEVLALAPLAGRGNQPTPAAMRPNDPSRTPPASAKGDVAFWMDTLIMALSG